MLVLDFEGVKAITIPEGEVKKITRKSDGFVLWKGGYTNLVPTSIDTDGTIFNGSGYCDGKRLSSSGGVSTNAKDTVTGFIAVKGGETIRIKAKDKQGNTAYWYNTALSTNYLNAYKADRTTFLYAGNARGTYGSSNLIESMSADTEKGISIVKLKSVANIAYIRISVAGDSYNISGADLIVTVNEEIEL